MPGALEPVAPAEPDDPLGEPLEPIAAPPAPLTLSPDAVRNSPEFRALEVQNRKLAREKGTAERQATEARAAAETARQAAEAQQQADLEVELEASLGADGIAAYNEIAELSQSDPRAAARKMASLISQARAQTPGPEGQPPASPAPAPEVPVGQSQPPASPRGLGADAPLGQPSAPTTDPYLDMAADLERTFNDVAERVQNQDTRRRVTMKDRANGMVAYVASAVLRGGARPSSR